MYTSEECDFNACCDSKILKVMTETISRSQVKIKLLIINL